MSFLYLYALFAVTTGFAAVYQIMIPVMQLRAFQEFEIENKYILYVTFFLLVVLVAPVIFFSCISPTMGERFKSSLYNGLFPEQ